MNEDESPSWEGYFSQKTRYACIDRGIEFNIYLSLPIDEIRGDTTPLVLCLHGAGYSGLTFAPLAKAISTEFPRCCVAAPDLRGHGDTRALDEMDVSAKTLVEDVEALSTHLRHACHVSGPLILVGWSMGAAIAVKYACTKDGIDCVAGLVAIDVVEGTAIGSLRAMSGVLQQRPKGFECVADAVAWALSSGTSRRLESAKISIPGMLQRCTRGPERRQSEEGVLSCGSLGSIAEASSESHISGKKHSGYAYTWRVDLAQSEPHWEGWFQGLSQAFLNVSCPKVLVLAGTDRLDKTLMIAHMQGKFQLDVIPKSGHAVHEDQPELVADTISTFMRRYKMV